MEANDNRKDEDWSIWQKYVLKTLENLTDSVKITERAMNASLIQIREIIISQSKMIEDIKKDSDYIDKLENDLNTLKEKYNDIEIQLVKMEDEIKKIRPNIKMYFQGKYIKILITIITAILTIVAERIVVYVEHVKKILSVQ